MRNSNADMNKNSEIMGIVLIAVSALLLVFLCLPFIIGTLGGIIRGFLLGVFGFAAYPYCLFTLAVGIMLFMGRKVTLEKHKIVSAVSMFFLAMLIIHLITSAKYITGGISTFSSYMGNCFSNSDTMGGVILGLIVYPLASVIGSVASYILLALFFVVAALGFTNFSVLKLGLKKAKPAAPTATIFPTRPDNSFERDKMRGASQVKNIGGSSLFVSTIAQDKPSYGNASALPADAPKGSDTPRSSGTATARKTLYGFYDQFKKNPEPVQPALAPEKKPYPIQEPKSGFSGGRDRNSYGINPEMSIQSVFGTGLKNVYESEKLTPQKINVQPDIKRDRKPPMHIYDVDAEKAKSANILPLQTPARTQNPPEDVVQKRGGKIIDGDLESEEHKRETVSIKPSIAPAPVQPVRDRQQKFIVGDDESEKLRGQKKPLSEMPRLDSLPLSPAPATSYIKQSAVSNESEFKKLFEYDVPAVKPQKDFISKIEEINSKLTGASKDNGTQSIVFDTGYVPIDFSRLQDKNPEGRRQVFENGVADTGSVPDNIINLKADETLQQFIDAEEPEKSPIEKRTKAASPVKNQIGLDEYLTNAPVPDYEPPKRKIFRHSDYKAPSTDLLDNSSTFNNVVDEECHEKARVLEETLRQFNTNANVVGIAKGPAVTRYELQMTAGMSVNRVRERADDIAYALAARSSIRIEAPIPGRQAVGVEVPNEKIAIVALKDIVESKEFKDAKHPLTFALGMDIAGKKIVCDLSAMPHLLIAGSTNSGKSSCLNSLITSLIYRTPPDELKLLLIDPKRVEFISYRGLPHLLLEKPITESDAALSSLSWIVQESERRYIAFEALRCRDIKEYKHKTAGDPESEKLPYIVVIIDEVADLMLDNSMRKQIEDRVKYISAKARAAGIHLVLATQRPSVDVITGTIKANMNSRIAFSVTNFVDSKTILDSGGAEKLLGRGDMLYAPNNIDPIRVQGAYVTGAEVDAVVSYVKQHNECDFDESIREAIYAVSETAAGKDESAIEDGEDKLDPLVLKVLRYFIESGKASISIVQRRFSVGFNRAANIVDYLEMCGYIGVTDGVSKQRPINITITEFIDKFGDIE